MSPPSRSEAEALVRAAGARLGYRWGEPECTMGILRDRYCVDCGAMMRDTTVPLYWRPGAADLTIGVATRPPCRPVARAVHEG